MEIRLLYGGLHGPGPVPRPVPGTTRGPGRQMRGDSSNGPGQQLRSDFSNGSGRAGSGPDLKNRPVQASNMNPFLCSCEKINPKLTKDDTICRTVTYNILTKFELNRY